MSGQPRADIASLSVEQAKARLRAGESRSDHAALDKLTDADIRLQAAEDPEERDWDWARASLELPTPPSFKPPSRPRSAGR